MDARGARVRDRRRQELPALPPRRSGHPVRGRPAPGTGRSGERALTELERIWATRTARIRVAAGSDAERRLARRRDTEVDDDGVLVLHHVDPQILAEELAAFGPEVRVLEPDGLRDRVTERLRALVADHDDRPDDEHGGTRG
ncbi:WYL domain-containing protein [Curtobacterium flaccumfaciens]|nr:WYL domain-containing protein [Curtobacterium flaccumfaciens]